jgi:outer membrane protein TolC
LFDGGTSKSQVLAQNAALQQTRLAYENAVLVALKDVEDALTALHHDHLRLVQWVQSASASTQAATLAQHRYTSGLTDFQTVLQTQRTLQDAQNSVASVQADLSADHVRLIKALGGGWQELPTTINR